MISLVKLMFVIVCALLLAASAIAATVNCESVGDCANSLPPACASTAYGYICSDDQINEKQTESAASLPTTVPIIRSEVSLIPTANESKIAKHKSA
ncbi:unnamed protein product [Rotaria socialis]|uniref:Uncharacterized protein n=1 Tax=Rotaria socialis TaxID=392032 RepID=A0A817UVT7_9BILA|nr:unnamed protein product [Rotaria socialis]